MKTRFIEKPGWDVERARSLRSSTYLLDRDPDLGAGLEPAEWMAARSAALAPVARLEPGCWAPSRSAFVAAPDTGLFVLAGRLVRELDARPAHVG